MTNKRFAKEWQGYRDEVLHPDSPAVQIEETERAFYAGAFSLLSVQMEEPDSEVYEELLAFFKIQTEAFNPKNGVPS